MPETQFPIRKGVFKDETPLKAEGAVVNTKGMRIHRDGWQTQRGNERASSSTFIGLVRGAAAWADLAGVKTAGFGTAANLYTFYGGDVIDVTPEKLRGAGTDLFTTDGATGRIVVTINEHGLKVGDTFNQMNADAVGGITLDASYSVTEILDINRFTITHSTNSSSAATGGGKCDYWVPLDAGLVDGIGGIGYGTGTFGAGAFGVATEADTEARRWSVSPWGQNMLANCPGGPIYEYQPRVTYPDLLADVTPTLGAGWTGTTTFTATAGSASDLEWDLTGIWSGGDTHTIEIIVTVTAGSFQIVATSATGPTDFNIGLSIDEAGTYTRRVKAPPSPTKFKISKDAAFAGTIQITLKVTDTAYRITSAPPYANGVVVDANNIAICWSTVMPNGVYNRRGLRWSDLGDNSTWIPSDENYAGFNDDFGVGSSIIGVIVTKGENLVFTDAGVYSMRFTGQRGDAYSFDLIGGGGGLKAPGAVCEYNGRVFWLGTDENFYIYQGSVAQTLNCPVRRDMIDNLTVGQDAKISMTAQAAHHEIRTIYADARDGNEVSRAVVFNWIEDAWYNDEEVMTERIGTSIFDHLIGFNPDGHIHYMDLGNTDNGDTLGVSLLTGFYDSGGGDGHTWTLLKRFMPDFDDQVGNINLYVIGRDRARSTQREYGPYLITPTTNEIPLGTSNGIMARQFALRFEGEADGIEFRFGSFRMDMEDTGVRY